MFGEVMCPLLTIVQAEQANTALEFTRWWYSLEATRLDKQLEDECNFEKTK